MKNIKNIFFDLDGTLLNSLPDMCYITNMTLGKFNLAKIDEKLAGEAMGNGALNYIKTVFDYIKTKDPEKKEYLESIHSDFEKEYRKNYYDNCLKYGHLYEGVKEGLDILKENNYNMYVLTNKPHNIAVETIEKLKISNYFISVIGDGAYNERKPSKEVWQYIKRDFNVKEDNSVMVGDGAPDYVFSQNAEIESIIVLYGITAREKLLSLNATNYAESFKDVIDIILK